MDFFELDAFLKLSKTLHFAKAASESGLSASALSRLVLRLESECGAVFFERNNREVKLTEEGRLFADFARRSLEEKEALLEQFSSSSDEVKGSLNVFASVTACYSIMPPFIKLLSKKYPLIHLTIETGDPALAASYVREGKAALAVAAITEETSDFFESTVVEKSPLVFAASADGPFANVTGSPQDIICSVPLILPKAGLARKRFDSWVKSRNVKPLVSAEAEGNEAVMALAALGTGIALVPKIVLDYGPYSEGFVFYSLTNALGNYDIGFIRKKNAGEKNISGRTGDRTSKINNAVSAVLSELISAK